MEQYSKLHVTARREEADVTLLWSPYVIGQTIIFSSCGFFFLSSIFFFLA